MIDKISSAKIAFRANYNFEDEWNKIPNRIPKKYTKQENTSKTIVIMGSSKTTEPITDAVNLCADVTKLSFWGGYNIATGCGSNGIMGVAYNAAKENSVKDIKTGKTLQNLAIVMTPPWGDEDIKNCIPICKANSEANRISKFKKIANTFVIFPGSATTIQEATSLIQQNEYAKKEEPLKKIILVGKEFFKGLSVQYQTLFGSKLLKHSPDELFKVLNNKEEILEEVKRFSKLA